MQDLKTRKKSDLVSFIQNNAPIGFGVKYNTRMTKAQLIEIIELNNITNEEDVNEETNDFQNEDYSEEMIHAKNIPAGEIRANSHNQRRKADLVDIDLRKSIMDAGGLNRPLLVTAEKNVVEGGASDVYVLIAGHRTFASFLWVVENVFDQDPETCMVPCTVREYTGTFRENQVQQLIELARDNSTGVGFSPVGKIEMIKQLMAESRGGFSMSKGEVAAALQMLPNQVSRYLKLDQLPDSILTLVHNKHMAKRYEKVMEDELHEMGVQTEPDSSKENGFAVIGVSERSAVELASIFPKKLAYRKFSGAEDYDRYLEVRGQQLRDICQWIDAHDEVTNHLIHDSSTTFKAWIKSYASTFDLFRHLKPMPPTTGQTDLEKQILEKQRAQEEEDTQHPEDQGSGESSRASDGPAEVRLDQENEREAPAPREEEKRKPSIRDNELLSQEQHTLLRDLKEDPDQFINELSFSIYIKEDWADVILDNTGEEGFQEEVEKAVKAMIYLGILTQKKPVAMKVPNLFDEVSILDQDADRTDPLDLDHNFN